MSKTLVIVESPAKARTISGFLGPGFEVVASFGHVRDLPESTSQIPASLKGKPWARLGVDVDGDFEPVYVVPPDKAAKVKDLQAQAKHADRLLLATDEDREGESISWHVLELLPLKKGTEVKRVVFHEVTPEAIRAAVANPRELDHALVKAQEVRRILDRLYGYTLSPLLWRKVARGLSAGRVQSVAVRLTVLRERERMAFRESRHYSLEAAIPFREGVVTAELQSVGGKRIVDGSDFRLEGGLTAAAEAAGKVWLAEESEAAALLRQVDGTDGWACTAFETKPARQNPPPPFMTSTLQQEAVRKLGMNARSAMRVAQQLYEGIDLGGGERVGLITYMRTDSLTLSERALREAREAVESQFGAEYLPPAPRRHASKAKNAQEAHEAIRPTDCMRTPASVASKLTKEQLALYEMVWKRTLACQMKEAELERTRIEVETEAGGTPLAFVATGTRIVFPGFLRAYVEGSDDPSAELADRDKVLPKVEMGERSGTVRVESRERRTKPPARYTEASLVKQLEAEGVGRPSTYASILDTIQQRGYVFKRGPELVPSWSAFAVTALLESYFAQLVDTGFTAQMEEELDEIAAGRRDAVEHLRRFYRGEDGGFGLERQVAEKQSEIPYPNLPLGEGIVVRVGREGPFLQRGEGGPGNTANIPEGLPPADLTLEEAVRLLDQAASGPVSAGTDPETGRRYFVKTGRFGDYLELEPEGDEKPRRVSLPPGYSRDALSEEDARALMAFPREIGEHEGKPVVVHVGRFGPYVACGEQKASLGSMPEAIAIGLEAAVAALQAKGPKGASSKTVLLDLGKVPGVEGEVRVMEGRYGPYVTNGKVNATLPKGTDPLSVSAEQASQLIAAKIAAGPAKKFVRRRR